MWLRRILILALPFVLGGCATFFTLLEEVGTVMINELILDGAKGSGGRSYRNGGRRPCPPRHNRSRRHR